MGKKSGPSPPPAPDPWETARADATFNRIDQRTPYGNLTYSGPNRNIATLSLSPELQQAFDTELQIDQSMLDEALGRLGYLDSTPIDLNQFGPIQSNIDPTGIGIGDLPQVSLPQLLGFNANLPQLAGPASYAGSSIPIQQQVAGSNIPQPGNIQSQLDFSGLPGLPQDMQQYRSDVEDAYFQRARRLLEPQFARQERALRDTLANQGLPETSEAFLDQYNQFNTDRGTTFANVADQAVLMGGQEASRQLNNLLAARGQGVNEAIASGQFGNQAAAQLFGQGLTGAQAQFAQNLARGQFTNQAAAQDQSRALQDFTTGMTQAGFGNESLQQAFANALTANQINNAIQQQGFGNQMGLREMLFGQQMGGSQLNLALQQQMLANQNAGRTQGLNEMLATRGNQFNELASLLGLQQVAPAQLNSFFGPGQVDFLGAQALNSQVAQQNYAQQMAQRNAGMGGLFDLGAALITGGATAAPAGGGILKGIFG